MYCNYALGQSSVQVQIPYVAGTPCSSCGTNQCSNNLCQCSKVCQNYGVFNKSTCKCTCQPYATGDYCEKLICNKTESAYGCWKPGNLKFCNYANTVIKCPFTCDICQITLV